MKMDKNIAIEFNNVGKQYRLGRVGTGTLSHDLNRWWQTSILGKEDPYLKIGEVNDRSTKGHSDYVWALKDIDFKVEMGDVVGIIGKNGAGKSTLLKLLSHITAPSTGDIRYRGRIASLLEVGTGFHPEMTARENIYMNGSIMGMTRHEITRKLDEIVDFAGIERYLDTPVKRFSSGMTVRLGFAVAAFLEPEILVVDEVLAVGDAEFQKKAIGKMKDVSSTGGRTVLFVSHNMASIRALCNNGVVLDNGKINHIGEINGCIEKYMKMSLPVDDNCSIADMKRPRTYNGDIFITDIKYLNENDQEIEPHCGQYIKFRVYYTVNVDNAKARLSIAIRDLYDNPMLSFPTDLTLEAINLQKGAGYADLIIDKLPLTAGEYKIAFDAKNMGLESDHIDSAKKLTVIDDDYFGLGRSLPNHQLGKIILCQHKWQF